MRGSSSPVMIEHGQLNEATRSTLAERRARGKALREHVPRSAHAHWQPPANRADPVALLEAGAQSIGKKFAGEWKKTLWMTQ